MLAGNCFGGFQQRAWMRLVFADGCFAAQLNLKTRLVKTSYSKVVHRSPRKKTLLPFSTLPRETTFVFPGHPGGRGKIIKSGAEVARLRLHLRFVSPSPFQTHCVNRKPKIMGLPRNIPTDRGTLRKAHNPLRLPSRAATFPGPIQQLSGVAQTLLTSAPAIFSSLQCSPVFWAPR